MFAIALDVGHDPSGFQDRPSGSVGDFGELLPGGEGSCHAQNLVQRHSAFEARQSTRRNVPSTAPQVRRTTRIFDRFDTNVRWWRLGRSLSPPVESERIPFKGLQLKGKIGRSSLSKKGHVRIPPTRCDVVVNLLAAWPLVVGVVSNRRSCGFVVRPMLRERTGMCRASIGELRCGDVLAHVWNYKSCPTLFMGRRSSAPFNHVALLSMMVIDCCLSQ